MRAFLASTAGAGLIAQLLYLPAGLLLAALVLEIIARKTRSRSSHLGVLALLSSATLAAGIALTLTAVSPESTAQHSGSAFAIIKVGLPVAIFIALATVIKWFHLRSGTESVKSPKPKKKRGRRGVRGKKKIDSASLAGLSNVASVLAIIAAIAGTLFAGVLLNPPVTLPEVAEAEPQAELPEPPPVAVATPEPTRKVRPQPTPPKPKPPEPKVAKAKPKPSPPVAVAKPKPPKPKPVATPKPKPAARPVTMKKGGLAGAETYQQLIKPLLKDRCYSCHSDEKQRGDLRLDTPDWIRKGGKSGPSIIAGDPEKSYLLELISLDPSDDDVMPPKGKPLTAAQISWIRGWIREGAALGDNVAWPEPKNPAGGALAIDSQTHEVAAADQKVVKDLLDSGVIVREISSDGKFLEIDYRHSGRAADDLRLEELEPISANIHTLDLNRTKVSSADLAALSGMENLRILHLQRTKIDDAAIPYLVTLKQLENLNLYNTQVSDAAISDLKKLTSLKKIYLWSTKVSPKGARDLASVLGEDVVNMGE